MEKMLSEAQKQAEVKRRARAGGGELPFSNEDEVVVKLFGISGSIYAFSQFAIYRIRTADEIDPDVTQAGVPWSVGKHLSIGTTDPLIHSSFGILDELVNSVAVSKESAETLSVYLLEFAVSAAEMAYAKRVYENEILQFQRKWEDGSGKPKLEGSALQLPRIESYEISFSIFFLSAKRAIGKLLAVLEWSCGFNVTYNTHLDKFVRKVRAKQRLEHIHEAIARLDGFADPVKFLNELRNSFEHPSQTQSVQLKNIEMRPDGNVCMPTWTLIHDEVHLPPEQDFGAHLKAATDMISRLCEMVMLISASALDEQIFAWEAAPKSDDEIIENFPCRWKVNVTDTIIKER